MASMQEAIRRLTIQATATGVTETADKLRQLGKAQDEVSVSSQRQERATQTMEKRLESIQRRYDESYRAQKDMAKLQRELDTARGQGMITQTRQNELMGLAARAHQQQSAAMQAATSHATMYANRLGPVGTIMVGMGPAGLAAAAGIGALTFALVQGIQAANRFAEDMGKLRDISESTGLNTNQLQGLHDLGAKFALPEDRINQTLQRFTAQMVQFRNAEGELFELVKRIDPALAKEGLQARETADAINFLAQVYAKAGDARAKLDRMIGGRAGGSIGLLFQEIGKEGGIGALTASFEKTGDAIEFGLIARVTKLKREIDDMSQDARRNFESMFSEKLLNLQHSFTEKVLLLSRTLKEFSLSNDWKILTDKLGDSAFIRGLEALLNLGSSRSNIVVQTGGDKYPDESLRPKGNPAYDIPLSREANINLLQTEIALFARRIGLLGEMATVEEVAAQKKREINLAILQGAKFTADEIAAMEQRNKLLFEYSKLSSQIAFERDQVFRTDSEAAIASRLRSSGLPIDLDSAAAAQMRFNDQLRVARDLWVDFGSGIARDLRAGVGMMEAMNNALNRFADKLLDMAMNQLMNAAFAGLFKGFMPGATPNSSWNPNPGQTGGLFHSGGVVGVDPVPTRYIHPAYFENAPRYHRGGMIGPGEVPIIAQMGERVLNREQTRAWNGGAGGGRVDVNVTVKNENGSKVDVQKKNNASGGVDIHLLIRDEVRNVLGSGEADGALFARHGARPSMVPRAGS